MASKLNMLGSRLQVFNTDKVKTSNSVSWNGAKSSSKFYGRRWRAAREIYLSHNPLCVECLKLNRTVEATEVDHIIPHRGDMEVFWDKSNWQSLCKPHHSSKTCRENGGFGNHTTE